VKFHQRCSLCVHERRQEIHEDFTVNHLTHEALRMKYFPERSPIATSRAIRVHFQKHFDPAEEARIATALVLSNRPDAPLTNSEARIFSSVVMERIQVARSIEHMLTTLMDRANSIEEEWNQLRSTGQKCDKCGRGVELTEYMRYEQNLNRLVKVFKEIREQLSALMEVKNPVTVIHKLAEKTFIAFVRDMTPVYLSLMRAKVEEAKKAVNRYLAGESDSVTLAKDLIALDDLGVAQLATEAETRSARIVDTMLKDLK
jgi:DNA repair exonuclease SbcCD ATPase subunit